MPKRLSVATDAREAAVAGGFEQRFLRQRTRRDDAFDAAFDRAFRRRRIADLFADRHRFAELHETGEITGCGVVGDTAHRNWLARGLTARGQRDVEQLCRTARIVVEQFVEIAHPVKQQRVGMLRFDSEVLLHHRGVG